MDMLQKRHNNIRVKKCMDYEERKVRMRTKLLDPKTKRGGFCGL